MNKNSNFFITLNSWIFFRKRYIQTNFLYFHTFLSLIMDCSMLKEHKKIMYNENM